MENQFTSPPIIQQPDYGMGAPGGPHLPPGCPPGLHYLTTVDQLLVKQKVEVLELVTGFETANKYKVKIYILNLESKFLDKADGG